MKYEAVIGLEVHAQLRTSSKMFCACATSFGAEPNTNICPVCTGQPGALPVINKRAVEFAIRAGIATGCRINRTSIFARKNYFYPDLPKGYQISQYDRPLCEGGGIDVATGQGVKRISITRIHLEEDAGKFLHDTGDQSSSYVDYNRSSIPLIEIVSGPDMRSPAEGIAYLKTLRNILMYLEICDGNMQEGSFRVDANISIMPEGSKTFGTRTELKNMNSFRAIERALNYEIERQAVVLDGGGRVVQETLLWNDEKGITEPMRGKEEAHDYRYFPEPDLPPLVIDEDWITRIKAELPELAGEKAVRFIKELGLPEYDAQVLTQDKMLADYYEECVSKGLGPNPEMDENAAQVLRSVLPKKISNWIMTELLGRMNSAGIEIRDCKIRPEGLARLVELVETGKISGKIGKTIFEDMFATGKGPDTVIKEKGLVQVSDPGAIERIIDDVLAANKDSVDRYRAGKTGVFGFLVGEAMKITKGQANPKLVNELLKKKLGG